MKTRNEDVPITGKIARIIDETTSDLPEILRIASPSLPLIPCKGSKKSSKKVPTRLVSAKANVYKCTRMGDGLASRCAAIPGRRESGAVL